MLESSQRFCKVFPTNYLKASILHFLFRKFQLGFGQSDAGVCASSLSDNFNGKASPTTPNIKYFMLLINSRLLN